MLAGRVAKDECMWSNIPCHHRPRADESKCPDSDTAKDDRACTNRRAILHQSRCYLPIPGIFELATRSNSAWKQVVGETDARANKNAVFQCHTFIHQSIVLNLYAQTNINIPPDLHAYP